MHGESMSAVPMAAGWEEQLKPWLEDQLKPHVRQMIRISQHNHALQYVLDSLVLTHSNPVEMLRLWRLTQPEMIDQLINKPTPVGEQESKQDVLDAWQEVIQRYTELLEYVVEGKRVDKSET